MVLVGLGVEGVDFALAVGVVEGVVDGGGGDAEARGGDAVDDELDGARAGLLVGGHVFELGHLLELGHELVAPRVELVGVGILERVLVLGAADAVVDGDVLHRLHIEMNTLNLGEVLSAGGG